MRLSIRFLAAALVVAALVPLTGTGSVARAQSGGIYDLTWNKVSGGGVTQSSGGAFSLGGTFGQADAQSSTGGPYQLRGGFWSGVAMGQLVDVPEVPSTPRPRFALQGFPRNPASRSGMEVSFTLASSAPAELDLLDVGGRRVRTESVGALGPGSHTVRFSGAERIEPGIYWLRLRQGTDQKIMKAVVLE